MIEWVLSVSIAFAVNSQIVWVAAEPARVIYPTKAACVAAGRVLKTTTTRVRCTSQQRPSYIAIPMPPQLKSETVEVEETK